MQDEERLTDDIQSGHFAPTTRVEAIGRVIPKRKIMSGLHGVLLLQRNRVAIAAGFR